MSGQAGHGICECGKPKITGPNGVFCPACSMKGSVTGGVNNSHIPYPTEKEFRAVAVGSIANKALGVSINGKPLGPVEAAAPMAEVAAPVAPQVVAGNPFDRCIQILKSVPAPRDIKSYKKLMKLISTLEELKTPPEQI